MLSLNWRMLSGEHDALHLHVTDAQQCICVISKQHAQLSGALTRL